MEYSLFCNEKISRLGFGAMRLPCFPNGIIDENQVQKMVDFALENGVNYFDTAYPYHGGMSEIVLGKCLAKYPRESFFLATKYPGHQITKEYNPAKTFEEQLNKCGVDYFDFYLMHNVYENCIDVYTDENLGFMKYFIEQKKAGRIKHLGFSSHGELDIIKKFLRLYENEIEFCQIQLNYIDWTVQNGNVKYEYLSENGIPIIIMEPLRGGKLCSLDSDSVQKLKSINPSLSQTEWAFDYLMSLHNAKIILSGMSSLEQMKENISIFNKNSPLSKNEIDKLLKFAATIKKGVPCTGCKYCLSSCPMQLNIPYLIQLYNDICFDPSPTVGMKVEALPVKNQPDSCMNCGRCEKICPQKIKIVDVMNDFSERFSKMTKWPQICKKRNEEAEQIRNKLLSNDFSESKNNENKSDLKSAMTLFKI